MNKLKVLTSNIIDECIDELFNHKKKKYIDAIIIMQGKTGLIYQVLSEMYCHGRFMYPKTYEYRRELANYYTEIIKNESKIWKRNKF